MHYLGCLETVRPTILREFYHGRRKSCNQGIFFNSCDRSPAICNFHLVHGWPDFHQVHINPRPFNFDDGFGCSARSIGGILAGFGLPFQNASLYVNRGHATGSGIGGPSGFPSLPANERGCDNCDDYENPLQASVPIVRLWIASMIVGGLFAGDRCGSRSCFLGPVWMWVRWRYLVWPRTLG